MISLQTGLSLLQPLACSLLLKLHLAFHFSTRTDQTSRLISTAM